MYCPNCGKEIPDGSVFCLQCGSRLRAGSSEARGNPKSSRGVVAGLSIGAVVLVLAAVLIAAVVVAAYVYNESVKRDAPASQPISRTAPPRSTPVSQPENKPIRQPESNPVRQLERVSIVDKTFPVGAHQFVYYTLPLNSGPITHVTAHFTAQGGANDIEVLVLDQDGFTNFSNGHNASTYYRSEGYVTTGGFDLNLRPGTYYVVFSNAKAMLTNKVVTAKIEAEY
jgi:hypothetical protein